MIGSQQARIIGILREDFEKDPNSFLTIKEIMNRYKNTYPNLKLPNYKTIATILKRLADDSKVEYYEEKNRLYYRFKNIELEITRNILQLFVQAFGRSGLTHLSKTAENLTKEDLRDLENEFKSDY
jgi:predicted transcriptional regulator